MAKADLTLNVGTSYNGEGLKKLDQNIRGAAAQVRNATKTINAMQGALGQVGGAAGKLAGVFGSFASGGVVGIAIAGVTAAFAKMKEKLDDMREVAKKAADEYKEIWDRALDAIIEKFDKHKDEVESTYGRIAKLISVGAEFGKAQGGDAKRIDAETAVSLAHNDVEKAAEKVRIAEEKRQKLIDSNDAVKKDHGRDMAKFTKYLEKADRELADAHRELEEAEIMLKLRIEQQNKVVQDGIRTDEELDKKKKEQLQKLKAENAAREKREKEDAERKAAQKKLVKAEEFLALEMEAAGRAMAKQDRRAALAQQVLDGAPGDEALTEKSGDNWQKQYRRWQNLNKRSNLRGDALNEWEALSKKFNKGIFGVAKNTLEDTAKKQQQIQEQVRTDVGLMKTYMEDIKQKMGI